MPGLRPPSMLLLALVAIVAGCAGSRNRVSDGPPRCVPWVASGKLQITVLGSGGPVGGGRAASSHVVSVDGVARVLVDAGPGAFVRLGEMAIDTAALDLVLLTHLHVDHAGDLPGVVKSRDLSTDEPVRFRIFGPEGRGVYPSTTAFVARLFGEGGAFAYLATFRNPLRLDAVDLPTGAGQPPRVVLDEAGLRVLAVGTDHGDTPSVAYRVEAHGTSVVFSGDLASRSESLIELARGADLLVYNAVVLDPPRSPAVLYGLHTSPARIGEVASKAGVRRILLAHLPASVLAARDDVLRSIRAHYRGEVRFAEDCATLDVGR